MEIIDDETNSDIVSWLPEGNGFTIHDKKKFEQVILPKVMKKVHYSSFTRRMNRWNFVLYNISHSTSRYFHPQFIKGDYDSAREMMPQPQRQWRRTKDGEWQAREPSLHARKVISKESMNAIIESNLENYREKNRTQTVSLKPPDSLRIPSPVEDKVLSKNIPFGSGPNTSFVANQPSFRINDYSPHQYPAMPFSYHNYVYNVPPAASIGRYYDGIQDPMTVDARMYPGQYPFRGAW